MPSGSEKVTASEKSSAGVASGTLTFALENVPRGTFAAVPPASVKTSNGLTPVNVNAYVESFVTAAKTPQPVPKQPSVVPLSSVIGDADASRAITLRLAIINTARITAPHTARLLPRTTTGTSVRPPPAAGRHHAPSQESDPGSQVCSVKPLCAAAGAPCRIGSTSERLSSGCSQKSGAAVRRRSGLYGSRRGFGGFQGMLFGTYETGA